MALWYSFSLFGAVYFGKLIYVKIKGFNRNSRFLPSVVTRTFGLGLERVLMMLASSFQNLRILL